MKVHYSVKRLTLRLIKLDKNYHRVCHLIKWIFSSKIFKSFDGSWLLIAKCVFAHFGRKKAQLCLWTKIHNKQWLVLGASAFQCMPAGFQDQNELHPKSASSVSRSVAIFPGVVQAYTRPYSFGGRIQLIIC